MSFRIRILRNFLLSFIVLFSCIFGSICSNHTDASSKYDIGVSLSGEVSQNYDSSPSLPTKVYSFDYNRSATFWFVYGSDSVVMTATLSIYKEGELFQTHNGVNSNLNAAYNWCNFTVSGFTPGKYTCQWSYTLLNGLSSNTTSSYSFTVTGTITTYTISYSANGGSYAPSSQTKTSGTTLKLTTQTPARDGYDFLGWSTDQNATKPTYYPGDDFNINANTILYAVWQKINYDKISIEDGVMTLSQDSYTYDGTAKKPAVTLVVDGTRLILGVDYTVYYTDNITCGTAFAVATGTGNYGGMNLISFKINKASPSLSVDNTSYKKTYGSSAFSLNAENIGHVALSYKSSNTKIATVSKDGKVTLKKTYGKATITVTSPETENYNKQTATVTIEIIPKKMKLTSLKSTKKGYATILWKKDTTSSYYQIQYATNKKFTKAKTKKSANNKAKGYSLKYTRKKTVYVRVRAVSTKNGTHYGAWSTAKHVKIK